ncbi:MAG: hypothetical protein LUQ71_05735 [Methanoregula sp.]|nr:hypothetical protein [Methanoregula sp.]
MSEDAVAPVVAIMLILAVVVTFFAAWNAYYVPSMKAQSEITHIHDVEDGFLRFSSDIDTAVSVKREMKLSEPIPLGGGEFMFDPVKSGGNLRIVNETEGYLRVTITNGTNPDTAINLLRFSRYSYEPVNNFWQDQGYVWTYGNLNVTKGSLATPLQFARMENVSYDIAGTVFDIGWPSPDSSGQCSRIDVFLVNISPRNGYTAANGNGNGLLMLNSTVATRQFANASMLTVRINPNIPEGFKAALWSAVNQRASEYTANCNNVQYSADAANLEVQMTFTAIPNMTLNRRLTEISLGAY